MTDATRQVVTKIRVSADPADPDFHPCAALADVLDAEGARITDRSLVTVDERSGDCLEYWRDESGMLRPDLRPVNIPGVRVVWANEHADRDVRTAFVKREQQRQGGA